jgi:hypothetical protein
MPARDPITLAWIPGTSLYFEDLDGHELETRGQLEDRQGAGAADPAVTTAAGRPCDRVASVVFDQRNESQ